MYLKSPNLRYYSPISKQEDYRSRISAKVQGFG